MSSFFDENTSVDNQTTVSTTVGPSQAVPIPSKSTIITSPVRDDGSGKVQLILSRSPTDLLMSPCSRKLWGSKRVRSPDVQLPNRQANRFNIKNYVSPLPYPGNSMNFILGTASKSRKSVVDTLGWDYVQMCPDIDEKAFRSDDPMEMPLLIAEAKAQELLRRLREEGVKEECLVLTADQIVLFENTIREKPTSREEAVDFLLSYSNRAVSTVAAVVVTHFPSGVQSSTVDVATINWYTISEEVANKIVNKGSIFSSAGGFEIEDSDLNPLITSIDGTVDSVLGLPVTATLGLIQDVLAMIKK